MSMSYSRLARYGRFADKEYISRADEMRFDGNVRKLLLELQYKPEEKTLLHPAKILRAAIEHKIEAHRSPQFLQDVTNHVLAFYKSNTIEQLASTLRNRYPELLDTCIHQPVDNTTWDASTINRVERTTDILVDSDKREEHIGFLPIGHGSLASAIEIYLGFTQKTQSEQSFFYPVRFSRLKKQDRLPHLTPEEEAYLQHRLRKVTPVIYDEDISSGKTIAEAFLHYRNRILPEEKPVIILANRGEKSYRVRKPEEWESLFTEYNITP